MKRNISYLIYLLLCAILLSCVSCSDPGADIEVIGRATDGAMTAYIDQTEFTKEETESIIVHFEVSDTVAEGKRLQYGAPKIEKYTRNGWVPDREYRAPANINAYIKSADGLFEHSFGWGGGGTPATGTYRMTYSFYIADEPTVDVGTIQLVFRVV